MGIRSSFWTSSFPGYMGLGRSCPLRQVVAPRYRLAGLPGEYQQRNISGAEVNYCLVTELIVWTQYEIQVAAYNGAGLGVFSRAVTEYTLQGGKGETGGR